MNKNLKAFLDTIAWCEGTSGPTGYKMLFGGKHFHSFDDHPNVLVVSGKYRSTAAGRYQILKRTWNEAKKALKLTDFSPDSQDKVAEFLIKRRGALDEVISGKIEQAVRLCNKEWASFPESPYGQPVKKMSDFIAYYRFMGGETTTT